MHRSIRYSVLTILVVLCLGVALSGTVLKLPAFSRGAAMQDQPAALAANAADDPEREIVRGPSEDREAIVQTDRSVYAPGELIIVTGSGWDPGETVTLLLHGGPTIHLDRKVSVVADAFGNIFDNQFRQEGPEGGATFYLTATGKSSGLSTQAAFGNPSANLDQWANLPGQLSWVNGNLGASKAKYFEGDSIPYRLTFGSLSLASHTVIIEWDTTKSSKHALDYITTFNRTPALPGGSLPDPCAGVSGCGGTPTTFAIPADPQVTGAGVTPVAGSVFTLYGGTITSLSSYSYPTGTGFVGDKSARISITFTASQANPVLAWGGHISTRVDWGAANSCVTISGSPFHTRLIDLDGSGGNQDRSLSSDATIFPGKITIIKDAVPNDSQSFGFTATGGLSPTTFSLVDNGPGSTSTQVYSGISNFTTYTIGETAVSHWTLSFTNPACTVASPNGGSQSANATTGVLSISLKEGEEYTCTFTNTHNVNTPTIATTLSKSSANIGDSVHDSSTLTGATSDAGGTVTYTVYTNSTCTVGAQSAGTKTVTNHIVPDSDGVQFNSAGDFYWQAAYSGDGNNGPATSTCTEEHLVVGKNSPTIATTLSKSSANVGDSVHDSSALTGATSNAGGTVTYTVYSNTGCSLNPQDAGTKTVANGVVPDSNAITFSSAGDFYWQAAYSGDSNNNPATSTCTSEHLVVGKNSPTIATTLSKSSANIGDSVHDSSALTGATSNAGGTVTYAVYTNSSCSAGAQGAGTKTVTNGVVPDSNAITFNSAGDFYWQAAYSGDSNNNPATSTCTEEHLVVGKNSPSIATTLSKSLANIGDSVHDSSALTGATSDAGGTVTYTVYTNSSCSTGAQSAGAKTVTNGVVPDSSAITFNSAGDFYWQAVYSGDGNNNPATSTCTEEHLVVGKNSPLNSTAQSLLPNDSFTLTGATSSAGGTITFNLYSPSDDTCAGTPAFMQDLSVIGNDTYKTTNGSGCPTPGPTCVLATDEGTWRWKVVYSGDANNNGSTSDCGVESFTIKNQ